MGRMTDCLLSYYLLLSEERFAMSLFQFGPLVPYRGHFLGCHHLVLLSEILVYESSSCRACTSGGHIPMTDSIEVVEKQRHVGSIGVLVIV